ncbi:hypothetical protein [Streptomyces azureus]|uniref:C-type lectin receptor n=1 Tax=Streptomyces azureus TaxID=146537 RepID=A0A0K8PI43_STRAJ|nr:hypothetical protein [Streptomyces azureus]GAP47074.1 C-type lectin receptor [Streptomyces azureus]
MVETLIAAFGSLVALGALVVSFMAHRHQVARAAALDVREGRIEARERALEQREQRIQASMIEVHASASRSSLHDDWVTPRLMIVNPSNQPIRDLTASYRGEAVPDVFGSVGPGTTRSFPLPPSGNDARTDLVLPQVTLHFTDAAGTRWRRDGSGGLYRGIRRANGEWEWMGREDPVITESRANNYPPAVAQAAPDAYPRQRLRRPYLRSLGHRRLILVGAVAIALAAILVVSVVSLVLQ